MKPHAVKKDLAFRVEYAGPIPSTIQTDPARVEQMLINLIDNAIKFTTQGWIRLVTGMATSADSPNPLLRFQVVDSGIGLTPEECDHIFEPFSQADTSMSRRSGGTGLGLSIVKGLVELCHGRIWVESEVSKGSTFIFELPLTPP